MCKVRALLLLKLLGVPPAALQPRANVAGEDSRRWQRFVHFYDSASAEQVLKKTVLSLQLTDVALAIASKKSTSNADCVPTLVRLGKGEVEEKCSVSFFHSLENVHTDAHLDLSEAATSLLTTHAHITSRFQEYAAYPFHLWKIPQQWNASGHILAIEAFLDANAEQLDAGYSLGLQALAKSQGSRADAIAIMLRDDVQKEVGMTHSKPML